MRQADVTAATRALLHRARTRRAWSERRPTKARKLTHLDPRGEARMVDVSAKTATERVAIAEGRVIMRKETLDLVLAGNAKRATCWAPRGSPASWQPSARTG